MGRDMNTSESNRVFLTGCDTKTEWQLEWFVKNLRAKNPACNIVFADFGVSKQMRSQPFFSSFLKVIDMPMQKGTGWFYKPRAMMECGAMYDEVCWLDTDIQILGDMSGIFDTIQDGKLSMCEDQPWSVRRGEPWHNSGVVAFKGVPDILKRWEKECSNNPKNGDQEILHEMMSVDSLTRLRFIVTAPTIYNWLRIHLLDGYDSWDKRAMHWTGEKGNMQIRKLIYNNE